MLKQSAGFTLIELVMVILIAGILSTYAVVHWPNDSEIKLPIQAELFVGHVRHMQALAMQWGEPLRLTVTPGAYSVSCVTAGATPPCNSNPVIDPATAQSFSITLETGISFSAGSTTDMDSLGRPVAVGNIIATTPARTYTLNAGASSIDVTLSPLTGFLSIS